MNEIKNHGKKWLYYFLLGVAIIIVYKALDNFSDVMEMVDKFFAIISPFFAGLFIAYLLYVPCKKVEQSYSKTKVKCLRKRARSISIATIYIIVFLLIVIVINFILPVVIESVQDLINNMQGYYESAMRKWQELPEDNFLKSDIVNQTIQGFQGLDIKQYIKLDNIISYVLNAINAITSVFNVFVSVIVSIYILVERDRLKNFFKRFAYAMVKERTYKNIDKYFNNSNEIFFKFIASQFLDAIIVGILVTIAMSIMQIKYAPLLGFLIGLFNIIPYVGAIIAVGVAALITLITGGVTQTIWMLVVVIILQQIDANIINPKIVGQSLKVSPLLVIFSITVGGAYFGMLGMFLAVPAMAVLKILAEDYINYKIAIKETKNQIKEN